ncbi:MAG: DUF58 domain-containing protein [Frankiaceae bacterium]|nr:DUF58 domain-containing protein [Frankiaceae bacterium]
MPAASRGLAAAIERWVGLTATGATVVGGVVLGWLVARALGGRSLYLIVYTGLLLVVAAAVTVRRQRDLGAERSELPLRMRVGQTAEVELVVTTPGRLSAFVLEEHLPSLLGDPVRVQVSTVAADQPFQHSYALRPALRGVYPIGPLAAEWTDPFGMARRQQLLLEPTEVIVHPSTEAIFDRPLTRMWEDPPFRPPVSKPWPQGFEFYGMRSYVPGDDPRRIVWHAAARTGKLLVRESEQGITDRVSLIIDTEAKVHSPGRPSETFELAVRATAALGTHHLKQGFSVGLATNEAVLEAALRGPRARIPFLDRLARLEMGTTNLGEAVERQLRDTRRDTHLVIVTPNMDAATAARARLLVDRGMSIVVALLTWEDGDPNAPRRARGIGTQVVQVRAGDPLEDVFGHALGLALR